MSSNSWSGNWASSAWTSLFAVAPVASEITWSSTVVISRSVAPAQKNQHGPVPGTGPCLSRKEPELLRGLGPRAELDCDVALLRAAANLQLELVTGLDRLAVDLDHDVAGAQAAAGRRTVGDDALELGCAVVRQADAQVRVLDLAVRDQLGRDALRRVAGHGVADAVAAAGVTPDLRGDADNPSLHVEHGAARVSVVQCSVRLDGVLDGETVGRPNLATDRADHAGGEGALETERAAQHDDRVPDLERAGRRELEHRQIRRGTIDVQDGDVRGRIGADDLGVDLGAVGELDLHGLRVVNDVLVRDDVSLFVDDEAGPRRLARGLALERRVSTAAGARMHLDDRVLVALVERCGGRRGLRNGQIGRRGLCRRLGVGLEHNRCAHRAPDAGSEEERRGDRCQLLAHQESFLSVVVMAAWNLCRLRAA